MCIILRIINKRSDIDYFNLCIETFLLIGTALIWALYINTGLVLLCLTEDTIDVSEFKVYDLTENNIIDSYPLINISMENDAVSRQDGNTFHVEGLEGVTSNERFIDLRCFKMPRYMISDFTSVQNFVYDSNDYSLEDIKK